MEMEKALRMQEKAKSRESTEKANSPNIGEKANSQIIGENSNSHNFGESTEDDMDEKEKEDYCFREGLSRFLIGMSVHLSSDVVSATMAHLLISQRGSRFTFSDQFRDLLVGQMYNHLMGEK